VRISEIRGILGREAGVWGNPVGSLLWMVNGKTKNWREKISPVANERGTHPNKDSLLQEAPDSTGKKDLKLSSKMTNRKGGGE